METEIFSDFFIKKFHSASTMFTDEGVKSERTSRKCCAIVLAYTSRCQIDVNQEKIK